MKNKLLTALFIFTALVIAFAWYTFGWGYALNLLGLTIVAFIQNMSFTWVSRSRNSGDPSYHRYAAWGSNGIWLLTQSFIAVNVYMPIADIMKDGFTYMAWPLVKLGMTFLIYSVATAEGSVFMMKLLLGRIKVPKWLNWIVENGSRKVGAS